MAVGELGCSSSLVAKEMHIQGPWRTRGQGFGVKSHAEAADTCWAEGTRSCSWLLALLSGCARSGSARWNAGLHRGRCSGQKNPILR